MNFVKITDVDLKVLKDAARKAIAGEKISSDVIRGTGCGRVYVSFFGKITAKSKIAKTLSEAGFRMTERPHSTGVQIYVGYDNCTGIQYTEGNKIARIFRENGISAGCDADGD